MMENLKKHLLYAGVTKEEFDSVKDDIVRTNTVTARNFSSIAVLFVLSMYILSFFVENLYSARNIYLYGTIGTLIILFCSLMGKKKNSKVCYCLSVYMSISLFLAYGIAISIQTPERATVTFMIMMMLLSIIFVDRPIIIGTMILVHMILFIILARAEKNTDIFMIDMINASVYGILSILSSFIIIRIKISSFVMADRLKKISEKDMLTGLNNRNCYESRLDSYSSSFSRSLCCIYIDANGLHELNNTKGHKAGDEMLCCIAAQMQELFGEIHTYRIGGDEFVAFVIDSKEDYIRSNISKFTESISENGYNAAVGYNFGTGSINISPFIEVAERNMYADKTKYYETHKR